MAIRRPSVYRRNDFVFQDFLYHDGGEEGELRYVLIKWDGDEFFLTKETFDTLEPYPQGGPIIGRIDYTVQDLVVTIDNWEVNWRDEWPIRLGIQYLVYCLYSPNSGYVTRVNKEAYPFWVSENFFPRSNEPDDYLIQSL